VAQYLLLSYGGNAGLVRYFWVYPYAGVWLTLALLRWQSKLKHFLLNNTLHWSWFLLPATMICLVIAPIAE